MLKYTMGFLLIMGVSSMAQASMKYECNRYVNGDYKGFIKVVADNRKEAEAKAYDKYKNELDMPVDYVKCK